MERQNKSRPVLNLEVLADDVAALSRLLTADRAHLPASYLRDPRHRSAYLNYFLPVNRAKIALPLRELALHPDRLLDRDPLRVLDIGTGPGTALLGILDHFGMQARQQRLELTAVDAVPENIRLCSDLVGDHARMTGVPISLRTIKAGLERLPDLLQQRFDLIVLSNVLNELFPGQEDRMPRLLAVLSAVLRSMNEGGNCIIIEPALRDTSRDLLAVRDGLLQSGFRPYAPCLMSGPCGALPNRKDWCHEDVPWEPPGVVREIDKRIGLRKDSLKFSYLVVRRDGRSLADAARGAWRVVSEPLVSKGKTEFYLCGPAGRVLAVRLDRDRSGPNEAFGRLLRGMIVRLDGPIEEEKRIRIGKDTGVETLFP